MKDVHFGEEYGIGKSFRRHIEVRALIKRVPYSVISSIN